MTYEPGWSPAPPPPPARRYDTKWIWLGLVPGGAGSTGGPFLGIGLANVTNVGILGGIVGLVCLVAPLIAGVALIARAGAPSGRGFGLGLIIGWAVTPIVFAGVCVLFILVIYSSAH